MSALLRLLWVAAGLALILSRAREGILALIPPARLVAQVEAAPEGTWLSGGFAPAGVYPLTEAGRLPPGIPAAGSWLNGDEWQGTSESAWFQAPQSRVRIGVVGYHRREGCSLAAEIRRADGTIARIPCPVPDAREEWGLWSLSLPRNVSAFRIVAEDRTGGHGGWLAFSHPFTSSAPELIAAYQFIQVATTTALALVLVWGPGALLLARVTAGGTGPNAPLPPASSPAGSAWRAVVLLGGGTLLLSTWGIAIWCCSAWIQPQTLGRMGVIAIWSGIGFALWRRRFRLELGEATHRVLLIAALVVSAVVAKSFYSVGPQGELFRGTVSRNFQMTDRIDSRYSFYVVQAATLHLRPASPEAEKYFFPWTFFSRGPLAGLTATPLVLATDGRPPAGMPEERWMPFDRSGFAAYRITMITLAAGVIVALFLTLSPLLGDFWSIIAAGLVALSPFGVHEIMFTWPKWAATSWLLASFGLLHARRPLGAGLMLGVGFMVHPLVLLWVPWLALWSAARSDRRLSSIAVALVSFGTGAGVIVLPWMVLGAVMPHLSTTPLPGQVGFLQYWSRADWKMATWDSWWRTRWMNFANTFLPLHLYLSDASFNHPKLSSAYETSGKLIRFSQQWWNSLPFGMGLGLWVVSLGALLRPGRRLIAPVLLFVVAPALFITAYWGMDPLGLMRECGHPLFVAIVALVCAVAAATEGWLRRVLTHRVVPWLQLPETWLMLWLTSLLNPMPWSVAFNELDAVYLAINALALAAVAWVLSRQRARETCRELSLSARSAVRI